VRGNRFQLQCSPPVCDTAVVNGVQSKLLNGQCSLVVAQQLVDQFVGVESSLIGVKGICPFD
jgi:hypothetical protein